MYVQFPPASLCFLNADRAECSKPKSLPLHHLLLFLCVQPRITKDITVLQVKTLPITPWPDTHIWPHFEIHLLLVGVPQLLGGFGLLGDVRLLGILD